MKKKNIFSAIFLMCLMMVGGMAFTSCDDGSELDTNQFVKGISLNVFGPSPVARGGELRFIGSNLNQVTAVVIPGCQEITDITVVSPEEIRVTVPQTAEPGYVVLRTPTGDITTVTRLTYTEPVGFDADPFSPSTVKPGNLLTISGEYLNLVTGVEFADGVQIPSQYFDEQNRTTIIVEVPEEAQTGKVAIVFCATGDTIPNVIYSDAELKVVAPAVAAVADLSGKKPGDKITLEGTDLDLVRKVTVADAEVSFSVNDAGNQITFTLPANTPAQATVAMYPASGIEVVLATIGMQLPTELVASPDAGLRNGDKILITGKDLDVVANVTFPGVASAVAVEEQTATSLIVTCPENFTSGDLVLNLKSGATVSLPIETLKPAFEQFAESAVSMGNDVTIIGKNLDLVVKVIYTGDKEGEVKESSSDKIVVSMPTSGIESGKLILVMANGETAETGDLTVNAPEFAYALDPSVFITSDDAVIKAGDIVSFQIENADKLIGVQVNGADCQYILKGNDLFVLTPENANMTSVITLISTNGSIDYKLSVVPNSEIVTSIWKGAAELSWSGEGQVYLGADGGAQLIEAGAKAGDILRVKLQPTADDWCVQVWEGHWGGQYAEIKPENYDLAGNNYYYNIELTDELIAHFTTPQGWGGLILVQGQNTIVTALELFQKIELAETIWKGNFASGGWAAGLQDLSWGGYDWASNVKVGTELTVYFTIDPAAEYDAAIRLGNGSWSSLPSAKTTYADADGDGNIPCAGKEYIQIKLTQDDINELVNNGGLVVCGAWFIVTKITIK